MGKYFINLNDIKVNNLFSDNNINPEVYEMENMGNNNGKPARK